MAAQIPSENWRYQLRRGITDLWFILSISLALLILVILLGYHNTDPGWSTSGIDGTVKHWLGHFGAYISDALFSLFGYAAYLLPVGLVMIGWHSARRPYIDVELIAWKLFALSFSLIALAGIFSLHWSASINSLAVTAGGVIGQKLNVELLKMWSVPLVMLTFTFFFILGITLLMELGWLRSLESIGLWVARGLQKITPESSDGIADKNRLPIREPKEVAKRRQQLAQRMSTDIADQRAAISPTEQDPLSRAKPSFSLSALHAEPRFQNRESLPKKPTTATVIKTPVKPTPEDLPPPIPDLPPPVPPHLAAPAVSPLSPVAAEPPSAPILSWQKYQEAHREQEEEPAEDKEPPQNTHRSLTASATIQTPAPPVEKPVLQSPLSPPVVTEPPQVTTEDQNEQAVIFDLPSVQSTPLAAPAARPASSQEGLRIRLQNNVEPPKPRDYPLPPADLLNLGRKPIADYSAQELDEMAMRLENALKNYKLSVEVEKITVGPVVTRFELSLAPGVKVSSINNLEKDIARSLAVSSIRVVDVIPGKPFVGLEMPNRKRQVVPLRRVLEDRVFQQASSPLTMVLGVDVEGEPVVCDLQKMPHLLVAGTTGSGKSVGINVMLASMLFKAKPDDLRLILIDPKMLEMTMYMDIPHLLTPVITDMLAAENALCWAVAEMERRYQLLAAMKVRKTEEFNKMIVAAESRQEKIVNPFYQPGTDTPQYLSKLPYIVIVIDEMADLMMVAGKNVEQLIARIAQKARAAGIHLILATQRPSVDVITGLIKANIPSRIAFQVSAKVDSRIILDAQGAENLLGYGDMIYAPATGVNGLQRVHGAFIDDQEVDRLTSYLRAQDQPHYEPAIITPVNVAALGGNK